MKTLIDIKYDFKYSRKRGAVALFILSNGGFVGIIKKFGSLTSFLEEMKKAGFERSYIYRVKKKFKKEGY